MARGSTAPCPWLKSRSLRGKWHADREPTGGLEYILDFNSSENNNSRIAQLILPNMTPGHGDMNATGSSVDLYLYSLLRRGNGMIKEFEIINAGSGYSEGDNLIIHGSGTALLLMCKMFTLGDNNSISGIKITKGGYRYEFSRLN